MRKRSSKARRHRHQVKVLQSEVMSPRIAWINFLGFLRRLTKAAVVIGLLLASAYGIREAIEHTFHRNPDFRLKAIQLNPNDVLDEADLVKMLNIDLSANIFDFDIESFEGKIREMPAIQMAQVERNLPGTLVFSVKSRKPMAWIACPEEGHPAAREAGSLIVDHSGYAYPCPPAQADSAQGLPMIVLAPEAGHPIRPGAPLEHPEYRHCLKLLKAVIAQHPGDVQSVDTISQENKWSLSMKTRSGTVAAFALGDHQRQLDYLGRAFEHSRKKGYRIETINLIPKRNIPITVSADDAPPRAIPVAGETVSGQPRDQRTDDLNSLLNRN